MGAAVGTREMRPLPCLLLSLNLGDRDGRKGLGEGRRGEGWSWELAEEGRDLNVEGRGSAEGRGRGAPNLPAVWGMSGGELGSGSGGGSSLQVCEIYFVSNC